MHILEHLANPPAPLKAVFEALPDEPVEPTVGHERIGNTPASGRLGNGVVQRAVIQVLADAGRPMRTGEVRAGVARLLGHPVAKESVSWSLRTGSRGKTPRFEYVAYATYRLRSSRPI
jgi:hypothetical protein